MHFATAGNKDNGKIIGASSLTFLKRKFKPHPKVPIPQIETESIFLDNNSPY